jgi:hypothetical protein
MITGIQLITLQMAVKVEIDTWEKGRMQLTRESALNAIKRLTGETFGRGLKGRQDALEWLNEIAVANGMPAK